MRNFQKIAQGAQVEDLLHAIMYRKDLWNRYNVRASHVDSAHKEAECITLRYNPWNPDRDFVEQICAGIHCVNYPAMRELPQARGLIFGLMAKVQGEHLGRVFITRLAPGECVPAHSDTIKVAEEKFPDREAPARYYGRYHIVLQSAPGAIFRTGDEQVYMAPGEVWWFDGVEEHEVINNSKVDRIHLICDIHTSRFDYVPVER